MSAGPVWSALVGQPQAVAELTAAAVTVAAGQPAAHAWLVCGPAGSGRSVAARCFAAALQCADSARPGCGQCPACSTVLAGSHPDVTQVSPEGLSLGVDAVRGLVRTALAAPVSGRRRVVIVEDADRLTEQAANVLLKPLEEPGRRVTFVLCAPSAADLLPTVRSRCRLLTLRVPSVTDVAGVLVGEGVDEALAAFAAAAAQGHVGRARRLATDEQSRHRRAEVLALPAALGSVAGALTAAATLVEAAAEDAAAAAVGRDGAEVDALRAAYGAGAGSGRAGAPRGLAGAVKELERTQKSRGTRTQRDVLDRALGDLAAWYRDVLAVQLGAPVAAVHPDQVGPVTRAAGASRPERTVQRMTAVLACREALAGNVAPLLAVEALALELSRP